MDNLTKRFASRKFLMSLAAFLASIGTSIGGLTMHNQTVTIVGIICTIISSAIYAAAEAYVDGKSVASSTKTETSITSDITTTKTTEGK